MSAIHADWGPYAVGLAGAVGMYGVLTSRQERVSPWFLWAVGAAVASLLAQVVLGVAVMSASGADPGDQHGFYGALIAVTFSFAYIYRSQFRKRPALRYGLLLLFAMGLGIRGIMTVGVDF